MRVLVFGASITQGFWDTEGGWVQRLRNHYDSLQVKDFSQDQPTIFNLGVSGDSTEELLARFEHETRARVFRQDPLSFVFSIGNNNAREEDGQLYTTPEKYLVDIQQIVEQAREFSNKILFVGLPACDETRTVPVAWRDINYRNNNLWAIEEATRKFCQKESIPHVPIFEKFVDRPELLADGLHPNNDGHQLIADLVRPSFEKLIS